MVNLIKEKFEINNSNETWFHPLDNVSYDIIINQTNSTIIYHSYGWGPKRDPLSIVIPITVIYLLTFFTGVIGNISTCIVIARNKSMHTATNYYLFSLAISDLLLLISGLPPEIYYIWSRYPYIFGEAFCILQGFAAETSANATVLTITTFTVERYLAICHPFLSHTLSKLNRAIKFVVAIWVLAMCLAVPQAMAFGLVYEELSTGKIVDEHCACGLKRSVIPYAFEISTIVFFVAPMSVITVLYVLIGLQLHKSTVRPSRGNSVNLKHRVAKPIISYTSTHGVVITNNGCAGEKHQRDDEEGRKNFSKNAQATKHVVKMLVAVVVAFFICWAPFHAQRLLAIYGQHTSAHMITAFQALTYVSGVFYYLSTTVNPLLYHIMSHKFREAFKGTYRQCCRGRHRIPGGRCYSTLSGRSSQVNSHSNTDSYSRQSSIRYLDAEMARLHDSRRPLVVSFRRKKSPSQLRAQKQVLFDDTEMQQPLSNLNEYCVENYDQLNCKVEEKGFTCVEVHNLHPKHICPLSKLHLKQHHKKSQDNKKNWDNLEQNPNDINESLLIKSCTMPEFKNTILTPTYNFNKDGIEVKSLINISNIVDNKVYSYIFQNNETVGTC